MSDKADRADDIHCLPDNGRHADSINCFCGPTLDYLDEFTKKRVWVHRSDEELSQ